MALDAEAAARIRADDPHALLGKLERPRDRTAKPIGRLARNPDRESAVRALRHHQEAARLQRRAGDSSQDQLRLDHDFGLAQRGARLADLGGRWPGNIVRPRFEDSRRAGRTRGGKTRRGRQGRVVHHHRLRGVGGEIRRLGEDYRDDLAGVADQGVREDRLGRAAEGGGRWRGGGDGPLALGQVGGGEHRDHTRHAARRGGVDPLHPGMGIRAPDESRVEAPGDAQVVHVAPASGDESLVFLAKIGAAEGAGHRGDGVYRSRMLRY